MFDDGADPDRLARDPWFGIERRPPRSETLEKAVASVQAGLLAGATRTRGRACRGIASAVNRAEKALSGLDDAALRDHARMLGQAALDANPGRIRTAAPLFAAIREAAHRQLGMRHYDVQLQGGLAMMRGYLAEMQTGEGKTLTATLAAGAMALTGRPVHVVTVNDYLAERDADEMRPVYEALGLNVGVVKQGMTPTARQRAYAANVTYCTNKELAFDYLKDRIGGAAEGGPVVRRARMIHRANSDRGLLRGLAFALIDEADSVLIDEARTPLILSGEGPANFDPDLLRAALSYADTLEAGAEYRLLRDERRVELTERGKDRLADRYDTGISAHRIIREELTQKALTARHFFHRDEHYLVREGKVQIIDEYTGRVMPERFWQDGLHQLIELKEGVELSAGRVTLARTTYQRFFRRYDRIGGMSGTAREVASELWRVYRMPVATIPTHRGQRRRVKRPLVYAKAEAKWQAIAGMATRVHKTGAPLLIGTRSVAASKTASQALDARGIPHIVLSADQDAEEARKIGEAGQLGQVTIATNMAGRGADIKLAPEARALGGLHVIMSESHDSKRIDRQLEGRAGRQGDPGWFRAYLSLEDPLLDFNPRGLLDRLVMLFRRMPTSPERRRAIALAQARAERTHARMRNDLFRQDGKISDALSFSGPPD